MMFSLKGTNAPKWCTRFQAAAVIFSLHLQLVQNFLDLPLTHTHTHAELHIPHHFEPISNKAVETAAWRLGAGATNV